MLDKLVTGLHQVKDTSVAFLVRQHPMLKSRSANLVGALQVLYVTCARAHSGTLSVFQHSDLEPIERSRAVDDYLERVNHQIQQPAEGSRTHNHTAWCTRH